MNRSDYERAVQARYAELDTKVAEMPPGILQAYLELVEAAGGQESADELIEDKRAIETVAIRRALYAYRKVAGL